MVLNFRLIYASCVPDYSDISPFQLKPDFPKSNPETEENTLFKYGSTRSEWEKDALTLAWNKKDITDDSYVIFYDFPPSGVTVDNIVLRHVYPYDLIIIMFIQLQGI